MAFTPYKQGWRKKEVVLTPEERVAREISRVKTPRGDETFGIVEANLGGSKLKVRCQDDKIRICRIPGKMRKRIWMDDDDFVLVKPWSIQGHKFGDIIWKYTPTQVGYLRRRGILKLEL
ncbi:MAG: translation initiation factor eIF-1A [Candidatus Aenigmatarchaeota archaeon]